MVTTSMDYEVWLRSWTAPTFAPIAVKDMTLRMQHTIPALVAIIPAVSVCILKNVQGDALILNLVKYAPFTVKTAKEISIVLTALKFMKNLKAKRKRVFVRN